MGSLSAITWNDLYLINRDYIYHGLINSCFQKAFVLLDQQRELVDFLSDHLIRYDLLRQYEIEQICSNFGLEGHSPNGTPNRSATRRNGPTTTLKKGIAEAAPGIGYKAGSLSPADSEVSPPREPSRGDTAIPHSSCVVEPGWGFRSRRRISRFIDFDFVKPCYIKRQA